MDHGRNVRTRNTVDWEINPARPAMKDKPLRCWSLEDQRDQKSPLRRCFKLRPPWRFGVRRFRLRLPVAVRERPSCERRERDLRGCPSPSIRFPSLAAVRPLVRMPTDRHAATGTCELGEPHIRASAPPFKFFLPSGRGFFSERDQEPALGAGAWRSGSALPALAPILNPFQARGGRRDHFLAIAGRRSDGALDRSGFIA